jgi:hypothetical protein
MANKFQRFLGDMAVGFLDPKGNMADYQHAARLYTDDTFRLAPKHKFLYYVVFNINPNAMTDISFKDRHKLELNYLVKQADLPKYTLKVETLNQYNRKTNVYTGITYEPVNLTLHDDNNGITNLLWALYYGYYIADRDNAQDPNSDISPIAFERNTYYPKNMVPFRYGLDNDSDEPFFNSVQIFTLSRQRFFSYLLCNPKITKWDHDTVDQASGNGILENKLTLAYDAVIYNSGVVQPDDPAGFAVLHYDNTPSPIAGAEILQNGIAGIFGDLFSLNSFGRTSTGLAGGLIGGLVGGLVKGLAGGNPRPYGYGQFNFLGGGGGLGSVSGFQQYGFAGAAPLTALTIAGVGLAANAVGNVISGVGSLFSNSNGSTTPADPSRTVEAPNSQTPAAADTFTATGAAAGMNEPEEAARKEADNPTPPNQIEGTNVTANGVDLNDARGSNALPAQSYASNTGNDGPVGEDTRGSSVLPSSGEQPAPPVNPEPLQGQSSYDPNILGYDVSGYP